MRLLAISDLHIAQKQNRVALETLRSYPDDWLILGGDLGETLDHLRFVLETCVPKFARVIWVPGNHELWTISREQPALRGVAKYEACVALCRRYGVLTPEDPYPVWPGAGTPTVLAPLFLLYDYTFAPDSIRPERAVQWATEAGVLCSDEALLHPDPFPSREAWCHARCDFTEARLSQIPTDHRTVLVNHFPLRRDLAVLPRVPRFSIWCGTRRTEDWHVRFRARAVVMGHLHIRGTRYRDGVPFEEVSLGYPENWDAGRSVDSYLQTIL
ncbi:MAG: metallophosphoesterase [Kofleriaceae bacterium]|nr:metallophosphoesterase [Kofleriaceae bacterium]